MLDGPEEAAIVAEAAHATDAAGGRAAHHARHRGGRGRGDPDRRRRLQVRVHARAGGGSGRAASARAAALARGAARPPRLAGRGQRDARVGRRLARALLRGDRARAPTARSRRRARDRLRGRARAGSRAACAGALRRALGRVPGRLARARARALGRRAGGRHAVQRAGHRRRPTTARATWRWTAACRTTRGRSCTARATRSPPRPAWTTRRSRRSPSRAATASRATCSCATCRSRRCIAATSRRRRHRRLHAVDGVELQPRAARRGGHRRERPQRARDAAREHRRAARARALRQRMDQGPRVVESTLAFQRELTPQTWEALQERGVDERSVLRLNFFFDAPDRADNRASWRRPRDGDRLRRIHGRWPESGRGVARARDTLGRQG